MDAYRRIVKQTGSILGILLASLLLTGCQVEEHIISLPDGRWHQEETLTLSEEEVQLWGQEAVDQYLSWLEEAAVASGESFSWQKEPVPGGVRYRIVAETAASPGEVPLPYGEWYVSLQTMPDGQWQAQESVTWTLEELQVAGGEAAVEQTFEQMCAFSSEMTATTCEWWKESVTGGVRYIIAIGGSEWDPSDWLPAPPPSTGSAQTLPYTCGQWEWIWEGAHPRLIFHDEVLFPGQAWEADLNNEPLVDKLLGYGDSFASLDGRFAKIYDLVFDEYGFLADFSWMEWVDSCAPTPLPPTATPTTHPPTATPTPTTPPPRPTPTTPPPTPTPTTPPPPTPTPMPTTSPLPSPDIASWVEEKTRLVSELESVDIPTGLFTVPGVHAYNEAAARELLNRINGQLAQGTLTPEQAEAFARLTLQERSFSRLLPAYTSIAASLSDTAADSVKTLLSFRQSVQPIWDLCGGLVSFCPELQQAADKIFWRAIRDIGKPFVTGLGTTPDQRQFWANGWDLTIRLVSNGLDTGKTVQELLLDSGIEAGMTAVIIQPYLNTTQALLDKGVRTADLDSLSSDGWAITGDTKRATMLLDEIAQKATWQEEEALSRHDDFQRAVEITQLAQDIADLRALPKTLQEIVVPGPANPILKAVAIGARLEHLAANLVLGYSNVQNLKCVEYLSTRAAEMAFDSAQPGEDCHSMQGQRPPADDQILFVVYRPAAMNSRLHSELRSQSDQYRQALEVLVQAVQAGDSHATEQAAEQLSQAEGALGNLLEEMQAILWAQGAPDPGDLALLEQSHSWAIESFMLYLAVVDALLARQAGTQPQTDLPQMAQTALATVDEIQRIAAQVDLTLPAGTPVLMIQEVQVEATSDRRLRLEVKVSNTGSGEAADVTVKVVVDNAETSITGLGAIPAGEKRQTTLNIPWPTAPALTVQAWAGGVLFDAYLESIPAASAPSSALSRRQGNIPPLIVVLLLLLVAGGSGVLIFSQSRKAQFGPAGLQVVQGQAISSWISLRGRQLTIGRDPRCELALPDPRVSARHALIRRTSSGYLLTDLGSTNGTFVNGQRVQRKRLTPGDRIRVGETELVFQFLAPGGAQPISPSSARSGPVRGYLVADAERYPIPASGGEIGRSPRCAIVLSDPQVSARHARLDWQGDTCLITDLGSTTGTFVNGRRVRQQSLRPGDEVRLGNTQMRFYGVWYGGSTSH